MFQIGNYKKGLDEVSTFQKRILKLRCARVISKGESGKGQ